MSEVFERAIRDMLLDEGNSDRVADNLLHRLRAESPGLKQRQAFLAFIINSGNAEFAMELYQLWFAEKRRIPFYPYCYLLAQSGFQPRPEFFKQLIAAHSAAEDSSPIEYFSAWEASCDELRQMKKQYYDAQKADARHHYQQQLSKLEYLKIHRMIDEERSLLEQLMFAYPDETGLRKQYDDLQSRWADAVIARRSGTNKPEQALERIDLNLTALELKTLSAVCDGWLAAARDFAAKSQINMVYFLAVGLYMLELYNPAIEALRQIEKDPNWQHAADWLTLECLLKSRRFAEALDAVTTIEKQYADDPETSFGATYARALALEGLGQKAAAAELVQSIVQVRPSYRSAQALLRRLMGRSTP